MVTYRCSRFVLPLPDRNRHVPIRNIPFPITRNTGFIFPSGLPVPGKKIQEREWLRHFSDRSRPFFVEGVDQKGAEREDTRTSNLRIFVHGGGIFFQALKRLGGGLGVVR